MRTRKPNAESRRKSEGRSPSDALRRRAFGLRISAFLRLSAFGFRVLPLAASLLTLQLSFAATNPPAGDAIPPLRPPRGEIPPTFWEQDGAWVILAGAVLLGLIALGIWRLMRPRPVVVVPPEMQARQALEPLRQRPEDGALLSQVSQIVRRYVSAAFGLPPGEMTTTDFRRAIADDGRVGADLSAELGDFLQQCDERKFAPVAAGILPAVEGGILPPGPASESSSARVLQTSIPPGRMPGSTAGKMPAATTPAGAAPPDAVTQALKLIEQAEARRAQSQPAGEAQPAAQGPRAYRGASKT